MTKQNRAVGCRLPVVRKLSIVSNHALQHHWLSIARKTKSLGILLLLAATSLAFACDREPRPSSEYVIGASAPLTGDAANYGRSAREGISLAAEELNAAKFLDRPLRVVFEDDRMNPRDGVTAVTKLVTADKVPIILGPFGSSVVLATAPVAERAQVVLLSASATADSIADAGDFIFRTAPPNSRQGADVADFLATVLQETTAAIVYQNNDYGVTLRDAFAERFESLGGRVVATEAVEDGVNDLRSQVTKIRQANPGGVFFPLHYAESGLFLRQAEDLGLKSVFLSADGAMTADMLKLAGDAAEGSYYTSLALGYGEADDHIEAFEQNFAAKHGHEPDVYAAYYYDATFLAAQALKEGGTTGKLIKDYLYSLTPDKPFAGVTGYVSFDSLGEVSKGFSLYVVRNGAFAPYRAEAKDASE